MQYKLKDFNQDPRKSRDLDVQILQEDYGLTLAFFDVPPDSYHLFMQCDIAVGGHTKDDKTIVDNTFYNYESADHFYSYMINLLTATRKKYYNFH